MAQSPPVIAAEKGSVAVIGCAGLKITSTPVPNPSAVEWWYDADNDPLTPNVLEHTGGLTYAPLNTGGYYVKFPWYPTARNVVLSEVYTPITLVNQLPSGPIINAVTSLCTPNSQIHLAPNYNPNYQYTIGRWTRDGAMFSVDPSITVWRPGMYNLEASGPCGTEGIGYSIGAECHKNQLANICGYGRTFEYGGVLNNSSLGNDNIIGGTLVIMGNCLLGAHFKMEEDALIYVDPGSHLALDGPIFKSCTKWQGIVVDGGSISFAGTSLLPATIADAEVAITIINAAGTFTIDGCTFQDNGYHIASINSNFKIKDCNFNSVNENDIDANTYANPFQNSITSALGASQAEQLVVCDIHGKELTRMAGVASDVVVPTELWANGM